MTDSFECDLSSLLGQEVYFYDPYIVDEARAMNAMNADQADTEGVGRSYLAGTRSLRNTLMGALRVASRDN